jgi:hypothetical protein
MAPSKDKRCDITKRSPDMRKPSGIDHYYLGRLWWMIVGPIEIQVRRLTPSTA